MRTSSAAVNYHSIGIAKPVLKALPGLFEKALRASAPGFYEKRDVDAALALGVGPLKTLDLFRGGDGVVALVDDHAVGCGVLDFAARDPAMEKINWAGPWAPADCVAMRAVCVDPAFAGSGVGGAIMDRLMRIARARGAREIRLIATLCAAAFYRRYGFTALPQQTFPAPGGVLLKVAPMQRALQ